MSKLSNFYKKTIKPIKKQLGSAIDMGSDFLPPGFRDAGNFAGKRMQGQSTKQAIVGAAMDYGMGRMAPKIGKPSVPGLPPGVELGGKMANSYASTGSPANTGGSAWNKIKGFGQQAMKYIDNVPASKVTPVTGVGGNPNAPPQQQQPGSGGGHWYDSVGKFFGKPGAIEGTASVVGGILQGKSEAAQRVMEQKQFERKQGFDENKTALDAERARSGAPLRDQATYLLQQRMGVPNRPFVPHDIYNESYGSGAPQMGGQDPEELRRRAAAYKAGAGGVNTSMYDAFIKRFGGA